MSKIYTTDAIAQILNVSKRRARAMCESGVLKAEKLNRDWYILEKDLKTYQEKRLTHSKSPPTF